MKPTDGFLHEGVWFSYRGHRDYVIGYRPKFMFPKGTLLEFQSKHHISMDGKKWKFVSFFVKVLEGRELFDFLREAEEERDRARHSCGRQAEEKGGHCERVE